MTSVVRLLRRLLIRAGGSNMLLNPAKQKTVALKPKAKKILAAVLHLMKEVPSCDQYFIVKAVFVADREHLNRYGRPITFDTQWALKWGPVPSATYDLIRGRGIVVTELALATMPWTIEKHGNVNHYTATAEPQYSALSKTDLTILNAAMAKLKPLSFTQIHDLAKSDPAYKEAWKRRGSNESIPMRSDLLIDNGDNAAKVELLTDLALAR